MRAPVPFRRTVPARRRIAADPRRRSARRDIAPAAWNALGRFPAVPVARLPERAARRPGCASPRHRLVAALPDRVARRRAGRRAAAVREGAQLRRIRVRLGLGRRLSPPRPPLLPQVGRRGAVHAGARTARAGSRRARRAARCSSTRSTRVRDGGHSSLHVLFPHAAEAARRRSAGHDSARGAAVPLDQSGLPRLRRLPRRVHARQAQEGEAGTAQASRRPASPSSAGAAARSRRPTGHFFYRCYEQTYREHQSTPYLTREFFERIGADAARQHAAGRSARATGAGSARRSTSSRRRDAVGPLLGHRANSCPACTSRPATTSRSSSASSSGSRASKAARRACTSSRADCCRSPRIRCTSIGDPRLRVAPSPTICARERVDVAHTVDELEAAAPFRQVPDALINYTGALLHAERQAMTTVPCSSNATAPSRR